MDAMVEVNGDVQIRPRARKARLGISDLKVDIPSHLCVFYKDDAELREHLSFLTSALDDPEQVAVIFGTKERLAEVLGYIAQDHGRDVASDVAAGRVVLVHGAPDIETVVARIIGALDAAVARGATMIRFLGFIGWGDMDWPPEEDLMTFEAKVTATVAKYPVVVLCTYNIGKLPGPVLIFAGIKTHPFTIVGTTLAKNPHYVPFEEYMASRSRPETPDEHKRALRGVTIGPLARSQGVRRTAH
jgi:hypothetical protein